MNVDHWYQIRIIQTVMTDFKMNVGICEIKGGFV